MELWRDFELANDNTLCIEELKPISSKKRNGSQCVSSLRRKRRRHEYNLGDLEQVGRDLVCKVLGLVDVQTLLSCLAVSWSFRNIITSLDFKRSWHAKPGVLVGSWTLPWKLWTGGDASSATLFQPLNNSYRHVRVAASAGGLVCISMQRDILELAVGNPLTGEWVWLPIPEGLNDQNTNARFRMEVIGTGGHFKVGVHDTKKWFHRCHVYDSVSGMWQVTVLHFPRFSVYRWSLYELNSSCWRAVSSSEITTGLEEHLGGVHELPMSLYQGYCMWDYKGTSYFASPWTTKPDSPFVGYGVWKVAEETGELVKVGVATGEELAAHPIAVITNHDMEFFISCNALHNLVCFMAESPLHPAMPVVVYDLDADRWTAFEVPCTAPVPVKHDILYDTKAYGHYSVAVVYSPSLLSPAQGLEAHI